MENIFRSKSESPEQTIVNAPVMQCSSDRCANVNIIDLVDIVQQYDDGKITIFDKLNFSIPDILGKGQFISLLGASGCGKSTILNYIANITKPTSGQFFINGQPHDPNTHIPMVFQQYSSFPWKTVLQNVALPLILEGVDEKTAEAKAAEMIRLVGLSGHEHKWAKYPTLSGGQLQRVAIARNLIANPKILLMDEPFGALDGRTRNEMQLLLRRIFEDNNGVDPTVILVTHDTREAVFLATDIFILGGKPSSVTHHIEIDLPDIRNTDTKKDPRYVAYIDQVDAITTNLKTK
jgi:NitT/TauT family transport system ATP-binding protein